MLSNTCKYALRSVIYISLNAKDGKKIGLKKISDDLNIPSPFLGKILQNLAKHKIISSTKGPNGGWGILKDPDKITILDIYEIIDGLDYFTNCLIGVQSCTDDPVNSPCPLHSKYSPIRKQVYDLFSSTTIGELSKDIEAAEGIINI
jgi:Rrf2 family protein